MFNITRKIISGRIHSSNKLSVFSFVQIHKQSTQTNTIEQTSEFKYKTTDFVKKWSAILEEEGVIESKLSVENFVAHVFKTRKLSDVYKTSNGFLTRSQVKEIIKMCKLRCNRVPLQYIIGEWNFRELTLKMAPPVFIPRPETEQLVDLVLAEIDSSQENEEETVLELCCGSGAISLSLLKERRKLKAVSIDKSKEACDLTRKNADMLGLSDRIDVRHMDVNDITPDYFGRKFKFIVGNPPYIPLRDMGVLQPELRYEDRDALYGGDTDGLDLIKLVLQKSSYLLYNDDGKIFLEVDPSQPHLLKRVLRENNHLGLSIRKVHKDICRRDRFVIIKKI